MKLRFNNTIVDTDDIVLIEPRDVSGIATDEAICVHLVKDGVHITSFLSVDKDETVVSVIDKLYELLS